MDSEFVKPSRGRDAVRFDTRVPMRYVIKSLHLKTPEVKKATITNMSSTGIRFQSEEQLGEGAIITVEILLPQNIVVEAAGKVARVIPLQGGEYYDIALSFTEISDTAKEEINMWYYSEKISPGARTGYVQEKRKGERLKVGKAFLEYRKKHLLLKEQWKQAEIKEISKYGISITARAFAKENDAWEIMMHLPAYKHPIKAIVRVVRATSKGLGLSDIALEFVKIKESDRKALSESAYIKQLIDKSDSKMWD